MNFSALHLIDEPYDSGLSSYALQVSAAMAARGHRIYIAGPGGAWAIQRAPRGVSAREIRKGLRRLLQELRPDILNAYTGRMLVSAAVARRGFSSTPKLFRTFIEPRPPRGAGLLYRHLDGIIVASIAAKKSFQNMGVKPDRLHVIWPCVSLNRFSPNGNFPERPIVGMVGRLDPIKGHETLLRACRNLIAEFPNLKVRVAGPEAHLRKTDIQEAARKMGLGKQVEVLGERKEVASLMRTCQIGVIASLGSEAVSRVFLEWLASGRAVVASRVGGIPEMAHPSFCRLFQPGDVEGLTEQLRGLLKNREETRRMGKAARVFSEKNLSEKNLAGKTEMAYHEALAN